MCGVHIDAKQESIPLRSPKLKQLQVLITDQCRSTQKLAILLLMQPKLHVGDADKGFSAQNTVSTSTYFDLS
jgi:hypothetical protein